MEVALTNREELVDFSEETPERERERGAWEREIERERVEGGREKKVREGEIE